MEQIFKMYYSYWLLSYCNQTYHNTYQKESATEKWPPCACTPQTLASPVPARLPMFPCGHPGSLGCSHSLVVASCTCLRAVFFAPFLLKRQSPKVLAHSLHFLVASFPWAKGLWTQGHHAETGDEGGLALLLDCLCDCLNSAYFLLVFPFDKARSLELYESFIFVPVPKWLTE